MIKKLFAGLLIIAAILILPAAAYAHVAVQPSEVGVGKTQVFNISVPTEKDIPTTGVRLVMPAGLQEVIPTVKPGWQIETKTSGSGDSMEITEIDWTGGSIPPEQRDDFSFSAQVPGEAATLQWKAYQTYADGSVVSWDQTPNGSDDAAGDTGPYSTTQIINDLDSSSSSTKSDAGPYIIAGFALLVAIGALFMKQRS